MKKFALSLVVFLSLMLTFAITNANHGDRRHLKGENTVVANIEVTLQNKCTRDVKYLLKSGGTNTNGVVAAGGKVKVSVAVGTEICVDGDAFMTVAATDAGQAFMVCR